MTRSEFLDHLTLFAKSNGYDLKQLFIDSQYDIIEDLAAEMKNSIVAAFWELF